ncbi:hypothetical protein WA026_010523 [Henosepilachna vigintioctopunctata]|uniref:Sema domain-containing protein n=1 Tax=Henosepilachna vigintioctopunctata TaxID=420089 RepID=A0AAW1VBR8_9CUCU
MAATSHLYLLMIFHCSRFLYASHDFRFISRRDLETSVTSFFHHGTVSYSEMLFDISRNEVLVSAKDAIFRLTLNELYLLEKTTWSASKENVSQCVTKGQSEDLCQNYIQILQKKGNKLLACGTHAFQPQCTWRKMENLSHVTEWVNGIAKCPYSHCRIIQV